MENEHHRSDANVSEAVTPMNDEKTTTLIDSTAMSSGPTGNNQSDEAIEPQKVAGNPLNVPHVYRQDIVRGGTDGAMIGMVTEVAGESDSDSESDISDDDDDDEDEDEDDDGGGDEDNEDEDDKVDENDGGGDDDNNNSSKNKNKGDGYKSEKLPADQVRVIWMDLSETTHNISDVTVVDRGFLHGDIVAASSDPTGQVGIVVDVNISVDLQAADGSILRDVSSRDLKRVRDFTVGDHVILGHWLGRVDDVLDNVTVLFDDGSMCKVMKADPMRLKPVSKNIIEDGHFPYYPGQRVRATSSSVFKNARWLSGLWKASRMEGTVTKVTVGSVFIYWIASASSGYGSDSVTTPAEEQSPKNLKLLSCFSHANWQVGDWCLLPSPPSSSMATEKDSSRIKFDDPVEAGLIYGDPGCEHSTEKFERNVEKVEGNSDSMDLDTVPNQDENSGNVESNASPPSSSCSSSLSVSKNGGNEGWPIHRKKMRKVVVMRDKKARRKGERFEKALLIVNTKTKVDVAWQNGNTKLGLVSTTLIPIDSPGDHEFFAEQYVVEKTVDDEDDSSEVRRVGVVKSVNAKERTACVRWLKQVARPEDPREFDKEEVVSVYELEGHPDYDYCHGDVVVRLSPVSMFAHTTSSGYLDNETEKQVDSSGANLDLTKHMTLEDKSNSESHEDLPDLSWVGNITSLKDGDIEVAWADGMVSTVGPQAIYVVGRDDDDDSIGGGSDVSDDDAASWETVNEDEMDTLEKTEEEAAMQNAIDISSEAETTVQSEENSTGRGPLSIPLAALGFVTRLATGFFSRGRKETDPLCLDSSSDSDPQSQGTIDAPERSSIDVSQESTMIDGCGSQANHVNDEEHGDLSEDTAEDLYSLKSEEPDSLSMMGCHGDDNCTFKRFDTAKDPLDHYFLGESAQNNNGRKWLKKVQQDWSILQKNLPNDIYVRVYEDRMDLIRAVIVGAYGTPYQDGLFVFDFHLPPDYPNGPPSVYYHSGGWRINPNLYEEGKVCLSLLNTWTGRGNEVWDPSSSSILQVLVSLQGLVLNSRPYFNEAGYDKQVGTAEGEKNSLSYNENTFLLNCKSMMYLMRKPPKDFEELIKDHFKKRGYYILKACDAYKKGYLIGTLTPDASISDTSIDNSTSVGFKLMLAKIVPKLISALKDVGADCQEFNHLQES